MLFTPPWKPGGSGWNRENWVYHCCSAQVHVFVFIGLWIRWVKVDEAAKEWTKKLAELSGMWSKQTGDDCADGGDGDDDKENGVFEMFRTGWNSCFCLLEQNLSCRQLMATLCKYSITITIWNADCGNELFEGKQIWTFDVCGRYFVLSGLSLIVG